MTAPRTLLVPTDFSDHADQAVDYAAELAIRLDAKLHLLHVISVPVLGIPEVGIAYAATFMDTATKDSQVKLDKIADRYRDKVSLGPTRLEVGDARDLIDRVAVDIGADLIVMGTHGRRGISRMLIGSVAEAVVRTAPCPVLTVRKR